MVPNKSRAASSSTRLLILLTDEHHEEIRATLVRRISAKGDAPLDQIDRALWHAVLFDRTPADQRKLWASIGAPGEVPTSLEHVVRPVPDALLRELEDELRPDRPRERLIGWLGYLKCSRTTQFPENWEVLWKLFDHEDGTVRYLAFECALASCDKVLARRLYRARHLP